MSVGRASALRFEKMPRVLLGLGATGGGKGGVEAVGGASGDAVVASGLDFCCFFSSTFVDVNCSKSSYGQIVAFAFK